MKIIFRLLAEKCTIFKNYNKFESSDIIKICNMQMVLDNIIKENFKTDDHISNYGFLKREFKKSSYTRYDIDGCRTASLHTSEF